MSQTQPRLKHAVKTKTLYPTNQFPKAFSTSLAKHLCAHLAIRDGGDLQGNEWEKIFADCIGATWSPSNVGLDDITDLGSSTAWGAKTVKMEGLHKKVVNGGKLKVRLISGRNSPIFSYDQAIDLKTTPPNDVGEMVLDIWNARVKEVRAKFSTLRTVVLVKGDDLLSVVVFEYDTDMYMPSDYNWSWNKRGNLEGFRLTEKKFTWQPHGAQFTIHEEIPHNALRLQLKRPKAIPLTQVLTAIGFDNSFYNTF